MRGFISLSLEEILSADTVRAAAQAHSIQHRFTDLPHHFNSGEYKLRSVTVYLSEKPWAFLHSPFHAFSIYAAIHWNANLASNESRLYWIEVDEK
jgi:hypothetical protein